MVGIAGGLAEGRFTWKLPSAADGAMPRALRNESRRLLDAGAAPPSFLALSARKDSRRERGDMGGASDGAADSSARLAILAACTSAADMAVAGEKKR